MCWLVPDLRGRHRQLGAHRRRGPVLLVRRRRLRRGRPPRQPADFPTSTAAIAYAGDLQIELVVPGERRAGHLPRRVPARPVRTAPLRRRLRRLRGRARRLRRGRRRARLRGADRRPHAARAGSTPRRRSGSWSSCSSRAGRGRWASPPCAPRPSSGTAGSRSPTSDMSESATFPELFAQVVARPSRAPGAHRERRDADVPRARPAYEPHGQGPARERRRQRPPGSRCSRPTARSCSRPSTPRCASARWSRPSARWRRHPSSRTSSARATRSSSSAERRFLRHDFVETLEAALPGLADGHGRDALAPDGATPPVGVARRRRRASRGRDSVDDLLAPADAGRRRAARGGGARGVTGRRRLRRVHVRQHDDAEGRRPRPVLRRDQTTGTGAGSSS